MQPAATIVRRARVRSRLTLRALARLAGTSHSALAAYESGRVDPSIETLDRIVRAAGYTLTATLRPVVASDEDRAREIVDVLQLAEAFPARPRPTLEYPIFGPA